MVNTKCESSQSFNMVEKIGYVPNSVVSNTIFKKLNGSICLMAFDIGEVLTEKISPFDTFIQIIEGRAEIVINRKSNTLETGQSIIIPAHTSNMVKANERFKMISTILKCGK